MTTALATATVGVTWTDSDSALINPTTITLQVQRNNGPWIAIPSPTQVSTGVYSATYSCLYEGQYMFEWYGITSGGLSRRVQTLLSVS